MELNPTTVVDLIRNMDWFAFPLVVLTLLPAIILAVYKLVEATGAAPTVRKRIFMLLIVVYVGALVSIKVGATIEDGEKIQVAQIARSFERDRVTRMLFNDVGDKSGIRLCDGRLEEFPLKYSGSFAMDGSHGADSLWLVYTNSAGVERINNALRPLAVGYIKQYLDQWTGADVANITFKNLKVNNPLFSYEFSEWLVGRSDLKKDSLRLMVYPSADFGERYAFGYKQP